MLKCFLVFIICLKIAFVSAQLRTNFFVKSFEICPVHGPVKYYVNVTTENNRTQYLNVFIHSPIPLDDNIGLVCIIETVVMDKTYIELFTIREKNLCKAMNKYLGEFWYDIQRAAQILPGVCPIPQGRYYVHHYLLEFSKITLQTFPFGTLRFTINAIDKRVNQLIVCLKATVENKIN